LACWQLEHWHPHGVDIITCRFVGLFLVAEIENEFFVISTSQKF
jgi:hypothetical protein